MVALPRNAILAEARESADLAGSLRVESRLLVEALRHNRAVAAQLREQVQSDRRLRRRAPSRPPRSRPNG
jgi:hypothetical protein